jgi:hypothetical protein
MFVTKDKGILAKLPQILLHLLPICMVAPPLRIHKSDLPRPSYLRQNDICHLLLRPVFDYQICWLTSAILIFIANLWDLIIYCCVMFASAAMVVHFHIIWLHHVPLTESNVGSYMVA